jgi:hypothetical protein
VFYQLIYIALIAGLIIGFITDRVYALSTNETLVECYIETLKEIENYKNPIGKEDSSGKEKFEKRQKQLQDKKQRSQKQLDNLLQQKDKMLKEIRRQHGEERYLIKKNLAESDEARLRADIQEAENEIKNNIKHRDEGKIKQGKSIKENIRRAEERLQKIAEDYSRHNAGLRDIKDTVAALSNTQKDSADITPLEEKQEKSNYLTAFGIPLGATPQETADALEGTDIVLSGIFHENVKSETMEGFEQSLISSYRKWNREDKLKEVLGVFDNKKFKTFGFTYREEKYYLYPSSFGYFIKDSEKYHIPYFEKYYNVYNSQFHLLCTNLPTDMILNGIDGIHIFFSSVNGETPRSFLLGFSNTPTVDTISVLTEKYGEPKVYYLLQPPSDMSARQQEDKIKLLKKKYPNSEGRDSTSTADTRINIYLGPIAFPALLSTKKYAGIYPYIYKSIIPNTGYTGCYNEPQFLLRAIQIEWFYFFNVCSDDSTWSTSCLFEWDHDGNKILLSADIELNYGQIANSTSKENPTDIVFKPHKGLVYLTASATTPHLYSMYQDYYKEVIELTQTIRKEGESKF